jgi:hypothetical protein
MYILYSRLDFFLYTTKDPEIFEFVDISIRLDETLSDNVELSGELRFVSPFSELRTCVRVFGNEFFP